ncbi:hypothetical protein DFH09DRAFT_1081384 [Mycena vulgaris]|nr:hypothetical protein DFH09DRAFT_1081384 [Mycena vulgaris]
MGRNGTREWGVRVGEEHEVGNADPQVKYRGLEATAAAGYDDRVFGGFAKGGGGVVGYSHSQWEPGCGTEPGYSIRLLGTGTGLTSLRINEVQPNDYHAKIDGSSPPQTQNSFHEEEKHRSGYHRLCKDVTCSSSSLSPTYSCSRPGGSQIPVKLPRRKEAQACQADWERGDSWAAVQASFASVRKTRLDWLTAECALLTFGVTRGGFPKPVCIHIDVAQRKRTEPLIALI